MNKKLLKLQHFLFLVPVLILIGALLWLITTPAGFQFTLNAATKVSGADIEFDNLQGTFIGDIKVDRLIFRDDTLTVNIEDFSTQLNLFWLFDARLAFDETRIKQVSIALNKTQKETKQTQSVNMPLALSFDSTIIDSLEITDAESTLVRLSQITAKDIALKEAVEFEKLSLSFPEGSVQVSGDIELSKDYDLDLTVNWQINKTDTLPAIAGTSQIEGSFKKISGDTELSQPLTASIKAEASDILNALTWRASVKSVSVDLNKINTRLETKLENTTAEIAGNKESAQFSIDTIIEDPFYGRWHAKSKADVDAHQWKIVALKMQSLDTPAKLNAQINSKGDTPYSANTGFEATGDWQLLQWPLKGSAEYVSGAGKAHVSGTFENYALNVDGNFSFSSYKFSDIKITGTGTLEDMKFSSVSAKYLDGHWKGNSAIDWSRGFRWQAKLNVENANPAVQWPALPGQLSGTVSGEGNHQNDDWSISGNIQTLSGSFRDYPVKGKSLFAVSNKEYSFNKLNLKSGNNTVAGNIAIIDYLGDADAQIKANWKIDAKNLSQLQADSKGAISSEGRMSGRIASPTVNGVLAASNFQYQGYVINNADLKIIANLQENEKLLVKATFRDTVLNGTPIDEVRINIGGTTQKHTLNIDSKLPENNSFHLSAESGYSSNSWSGKIKGLDITTENFGQWHLPSPSAFKVSGKQWQIDNACLSLKIQPASACFAISSDTELKTYRVNGDLKSIPFSLFQKSLPEFVTQIEGTLNGDSFLVIDNDRIKTFSLALKSEGGKLTHNILNKNPETIIFKNLSVTGKQINQDIALSANADLQQTGNAVVKITLPRLGALSEFSANQAIEGMINIELKDLSSLQAFIPEVHTIEGETSSNFHISGTLNKPVLTGESSLTASVITLPQVGLELKDTKLNAHSTKSKALVFEGITHSGDGLLNIKGDIPDYNAENVLVKLDARGKQFLAVKTPDIEMELSPELLLILENNAVNVNGAIYIDRAQISLLDTFAGLTPSSDVVIIDSQANLEKETPLVLAGQIRLKLSDRIYVQGAGFVGRITGELLITEKPGDVTRATGELIIKDGRYSSPVKGDNIPGLLISIAQKELIIDEGRLIFASSPIDNPRIDIRARRPTSNMVSAGVETKVSVGVDIKGHVNNPQITLYSEPAMDQADILAYLTLGYPLTEASKNDGQYLARIASSIGLVGGEKLAKGIAKEFGIDEVYIQSEDTTQQAQLVLGKYLSPKLYIRYAVGIGEAVDTLQIQYKLTDRWMLRTESAVTKQGTDLIYTIEKD